MSGPFLVFDRRKLLKAVAGLAVLLVASPLAAGGLSARHHLLAQCLVSVFRNKAGARRVGRSYLEGPGEGPGQESDATSLLAAILGDDATLRRALDDGDPAAVRAALRTCLERDFANGRTACVDGWLLSQTEARLCALAQFV